jgi:hypothetical protein
MKSVGEIRVSPSMNPSENRVQSSVMSDDRAPQISAKTGSEASVMAKPKSTGTSPSRPSSSVRITIAQISPISRCRIRRSVRSAIEMIVGWISAEAACT